MMFKDETRSTFKSSSVSVLHGRSITALRNRGMGLLAAKADLSEK